MSSKDVPHIELEPASALPDWMREALPDDVTNDKPPSGNMHTKTDGCASRRQGQSVRLVSLYFIFIGYPPPMFTCEQHLRSQPRYHLRVPQSSTVGHWWSCPWKNVNSIIFWAVYTHISYSFHLLLVVLEPCWFLEWEGKILRAFFDLFFTVESQVYYFCLFTVLTHYNYNIIDNIILAW